jgi:thiosulfate/3-mercaptopyruvate sulfurtransferase
MRKNGQVNSPLVSCAALAEALAGPTVPVLLDVRWRLGGPPGRLDYDRAHLPGAVYVDLDTDLAAEPGAGGRHPLPDPADLQRVLRAAGVRSDSFVVVYDDDNGSIAARAWWLLRWVGHTRVAVLDGGFKAWAAKGLSVTAEVPRPEPGDLVVRPGAMPVVDADGAAELARTGVLIDARAPERYRGEVEPIDPRAGHIPGAINAPFAAHVDADGHWRPATELAERFATLGIPAGARSPAEAGAGTGVVGSATGAGDDIRAAAGLSGAPLGTAAVDPASRGAEGTSAAADAPAGAVGAAGATASASAPGAAPAGAAEGGAAAGGGESRVGAYCGSGVTATSVLLALEVAGVTSADNPGVLYAGSWSHWSADPDRPVATGPEPQ